MTGPVVALRFWLLQLIGSGRAWHVSEMLLHVAAGTKKSCSLPRPETNADGAPRLDAPVLKIHMTSIATTVPAPLSVAPVPAAHESDGHPA